MADTEFRTGSVGEPDALEQIRLLREQMETLLRQRVPPIINDAASQVQDVARQASSYVRDESDALAAKIRERPLTWIAAAAGVGYLVARITR